VLSHASIVREIIDLKHFSVRAYRACGWLAVAFVLLTFSNLAKVIGFGRWVASIGNAAFLFTAIFTAAVVYTAWRRAAANAKRMPILRCSKHTAARLSRPAIGRTPHTGGRIFPAVGVL
jgi:hypothetical protein